MFLRNYLINYEVKNYSHQKFIKEKHRGVNHRFTPLCVSTRSGTTILFFGGFLLHISINTPYCLSTE